MVAVIGRVDDIRVVQLAQIFQLLVNLLTTERPLLKINGPDSGGRKLTRGNGVKTSMNHRTYPVHGIVHALQRLKPLGHQEIRELFVNGLHFLRDLQYPLLVGIRRVVVGRGAMEQAREKKEKRRKRKSLFEMASRKGTNHV